MSVHLKYFQKFPNAGDQFSRVVAQRYIAPDIIPCDRSPLRRPNLVLLGSILDWADARSIVCGAGLISAESKMSVAPAAINCVRGPLTEASLEKQGMRTTGVFGDPGILAAELFPMRGSPDTPIGIVPHYVDASAPWLRSCRDRGVLVIDTLAPLEQYFAGLQRCETILTSSLHGLIFAHSFGKPALWIEMSDRVIGRGFKFHDYYASIGVAKERVVRVCIDGSSDPAEVAKFATTGDHSRLLPGLRSALDDTRRQLQGVS